MLLTLCVGVLNTGGMDWLAIATLTRYATATAIPVFRSLLKQEEKDHVQPGLDTKNSVIRVSENDLSQDFDNNNDA